MAKKKQSDEEGKSIWWVVGMVMLLTAYIGWACAASKYAVDVGDYEPIETYGPWYASAINLLIFSIIEIPNCFSVLIFTIRNHLWLIITTMVLELLILMAGLGLKRVEEKLSRSPH